MTIFVFSTKLINRNTGSWLGRLQIIKITQRDEVCFGLGQFAVSLKQIQNGRRCCCVWLSIHQIAGKQLTINPQKSSLRLHVAVRTRLEGAFCEFWGDLMTCLSRLVEPNNSFFPRNPTWGECRRCWWWWDLVCFFFTFCIVLYSFNAASFS